METVRWEIKKKKTTKKHFDYFISYSDPLAATLIFSFFVFFFLEPL